ncbi:MAG: DUF1802 family protein [Candidatus Omnitrophica bacterium]|nr:DUF1802 family protein [Candidatus Omnitrophota bacterium]
MKIALKEWATVIEALGRGEQLLLIRKGGLSEPGGGFEMVSNSFVFYPTFEHQAVNYVRPECRRYFEQASARRAPAGQVRFDLVGAVEAVHQARDPALIERLRAFHIYGPEFAAQRLKWQPQQPMTLAVVRAFRLASPCTVPALPRYGGCTSWVELEAPVPVEGRQPVLDDAAFAARLKDLQAQLVLE